MLNKTKGKELRILALCLVMIVLSVTVYFAIPSMAPVSSDQAVVRIKITTFNWGFNVTNIPDFQLGKVYASPTITVHKGQRVIIELRTLDISHGFAIDELNVKGYVPPGETVTVSFVADRSGNFTYYCPVFCGIGHPYMKGTFQVLP